MGDEPEMDRQATTENVIRGRWHHCLSGSVAVAGVPDAVGPAEGALEAGAVDGPRRGRGRPLPRRRRRHEAQAALPRLGRPRPRRGRRAAVQRQSLRLAADRRQGRPPARAPRRVPQQLRSTGLPWIRQVVFELDFHKRSMSSCTTKPKPLSFRIFYLK